MEKAMHQAYGMGYEEYARVFSNQLKVEKEREKEHKKAQRISEEQNRIAFK
jgi:hypothetical protein